MKMRAVLASGIVAAAGCAASLHGTTPHLTGLGPDSLDLIDGNVAEIDISGAGFDTLANNTIHIGSLAITGVPSREGGTVIRVAVPSMVSSGGEAPPAPWATGRYPVVVTTRGGSSDTLWLRIRTPGSRP